MPELWGSAYPGIALRGCHGDSSSTLLRRGCSPKGARLWLEKYDVGMGAPRENKVKIKILLVNVKVQCKRLVSHSWSFK